MWLISKHDGSKYVQHNVADGTYWRFEKDSSCGCSRAAAAAATAAAAAAVAAAAVAAAAAEVLRLGGCGKTF